MKLRRQRLALLGGALASRHRRRGNVAVEYALVLALIVVVCIGNLRMLGSSSARMFESIGRVLESGETFKHGSTAGIQEKK